MLSKNVHQVYKSATGLLVPKPGKDDTSAAPGPVTFTMSSKMENESFITILNICIKGREDESDAQLPETPIIKTRLLQYQYGWGLGHSHVTWKHTFEWHWQLVASVAQQQEVMRGWSESYWPYGHRQRVAGATPEQRYDQFSPTSQHPKFCLRSPRRSSPVRRFEKIVGWHGQLVASVAQQQEVMRGRSESYWPYGHRQRVAGATPNSGTTMQRCVFRFFRVRIVV